MTAAKDFTWNFSIAGSVAAYVASLDALGSAQLQDHATEPPVPPLQPYADQLNQWALQLGGVNRVIEGAIFDVIFTAGTPSIAGATAMSDIITTTWAQANLTVTHTGTGIVTLTWPSVALPPPRAKPFAWVTQDVACMQAIALTVGSGVQVKTRNSAGTLADLNFSVAVR